MLVAVVVTLLGLLAGVTAAQLRGLRLGGVVVLPLFAVFAFRNAWLLPVYLFASATAYAAILAIHHWTLLYGRVLLSMGAVVALLSTVSVVPALPVDHGLLPFFTAVLAGVTGYNLHVVAPAERRATVATSAGVFLLFVAAARLLLTPAPLGLLATLAWWHGFAAALVLPWAAVEAVRLELRVPYSPVWAVKRRAERVLEVSL